MHNMHDTFRLTVQDTENQGWQKAGPVQSGVPRHWGSVRCGCIEGVLATAILAGQHPDVWDAAVCCSESTTSRPYLCCL